MTDIFLIVHWELTYEMIRIRNLYCFIYGQRISLREKERWLFGEVFDHVGIYGSKVAEGLSVFNVGLVVFVPTSPFTQLDKKNEAFYDDVMTWKCFSHCWPYVRVIHNWLVVSLTNSQYCRALIFSLLLTRTIHSLNMQVVDDLRYPNALATSLQHRDLKTRCL